MQLTPDVPLVILLLQHWDGPVWPLVVVELVMMPLMTLSWLVHERGAGIDSSGPKVGVVMTSLQSSLIPGVV